MNNVSQLWKLSPDRIPKIIVVGSGIAGMASAYWLAPHADVWVVEKNAYLGGHTNTIEVNSTRFDTGFMVFNHVTYPLLTQLFKQLDVAVQPTDMSFSVQYQPDALEWAGASWGRLFGDRRNLLNMRFWRMLMQLDRFNKQSVEDLYNGLLVNQRLDDYLRYGRYGDDLLNWYLAPMSAAIWSTPPGKIRDFPAQTLVRFFHNHGFLGMTTQHPWVTVSQGASSYVPKITAAYRDQCILNDGVVSIAEIKQSDVSTGVCVTLQSGNTIEADAVVCASHADHTLAMLAEPTQEEQTVLSPFRYQTNRVWVHSDTSVMPKKKACWSAWNYRVSQSAIDDPLTPPSVHYWMNLLQDLSNDVPYFVSLNANECIDPAKIHRELTYEHPLFDLHALEAQAKLPALNHHKGDHQRIFYCGSYFRYGFHEDALLSAYQLCRLLLGSDPMPVVFR